MDVPTTKEIREWLECGKAQGATHMLVVCDTFDWSDYPVFVMPGENVREIAKKNGGPNMTRLMEVYNLALPFDEQLTPFRRVFNY